MDNYNGFNEHENNEQANTGYYGNYPDAVAFSVLLANICVPLIDHYTQPRLYGTRK